MVVTGDFARYRYISTIGSGGMGRVDLAEDTRLGRRVALKRMGGPADTRGVARLRREALAGASLSHVNLVSVYDVVTSEDGHLIVVMEYIPGGTLRDELNRRHKLPPGDALRVLEGVAAGLDAIHQRGIVHRDVKPSNILLGDEGAVKVADLGIAAVADRTRITTSGAVFGSLSYMAPEQLDASPSTPAIDIYALSAVAYEVLSGEKARRETNPVTLAYAIATQPPPDLRNVWRQAPPGAADVLVKGMARHPSERPSSAGDLVRRLRAALATEVATSMVRSGRSAGGDERGTQRHRMPGATPPRPSPVPANPRATGPPGLAASQRTSRLGTPASRASSHVPSAGSAGRPAAVLPAADVAADRASQGGGRGGERGRQGDRFGLAGGGRGGHHGYSPRRLAVVGLLALVAVGVALAIVLNSSGSGSRPDGGATSAGRDGQTTATRHRHNSSGNQPSSSSSSAATRQTAANSASARTPAASSAADATTSTSSSASPPAPTSSSSSTPAAAPATTAPTPAGSPVRAVEAFYQAAATHDYPGAWALADLTLRAQLEGYQSFAAGQAGDRSITFDNAKTIRQSSSGATVAVQTTSVRDNGTKHCTGTVDLVPAGDGQWHLHLLHINCA